jgi:hypothetical protein
MQPVFDDRYLTRVHARLQTLEQQESTMKLRLHETTREMVRVTASTEVELGRLKEDLASLERDVRLTADRLRETMLHFHALARSTELERLQARIEQWAPEQRVTTEQFKRMLRDEEFFSL